MICYINSYNMQGKYKREYMHIWKNTSKLTKMLMQTTLKPVREQIKRLDKIKDQYQMFNTK